METYYGLNILYTSWFKLWTGIDSSSRILYENKLWVYTTNCDAASELFSANASNLLDCFFQRSSKMDDYHHVKVYENFVCSCKFFRRTRVWTAVHWMEGEQTTSFFTVRLNSIESDTVLLFSKSSSLVDVKFRGLAAPPGDSNLRGALLCGNYDNVVCLYVYFDRQ